MSSDDFQTKYASFMESMLKGAVAETTKLYEAMVDELKEEISRIKKENEDLKTRCSQFESAQSQPADVAGEASTPQEENSDADKCDTAIQCDLAPAHTTLVEQCQPMGHLIHDHLYALEDVDYGVHGSDHKYYRVGSSQMGFVHVKQEESSNISLESSVKQEAVDPTVFAGSSNAGSQQASASTTENEEPTNNQTGSQEEISSPQDKGTSVVLELPHLGVHSSDQQHSIVISLASLSQNIKEESGAVHEASAPMQLELILPEELVADRQRDSGSDVNQQPAVQQSENVSQSEEQLTRPVLATQEIVSEKSENVLAKGGPESKTTSSAECGRQTPDKMKQNEIQGSSSDFSQMVLNFTSVRENSFEVSPTIDSVDTPTAKSPQALPGHSEETTSIETPPITEGENAALDHTGNGKLVSSTCPSEKQKSLEFQQLPMEVGETTKMPSAEIVAANDTATLPVVPTRAKPVKHRTRATSATLQDAMLLVEAMNQSPVETTSPSSQEMVPVHTQSVSPLGTLQAVEEIPEKSQSSAHGDVSHATATKPTNDGKTHIAVVIPKQNTVTFSDTKTSKKTSTETQTTVQPPAHPLKTTSKGPHTIIVVPRAGLASKIAAVAQTQHSTGVSTAPQKKSFFTTSVVAGLPVGTYTLPFLPKKTNKNAGNPNLPSQLTTTFTGKQFGILPQPVKTIIISRPAEPVAPSLQQLQKPGEKGEQKTGEPAVVVPGSLTLLVSNIHNLTIPPSNEMVPPQDIDKTTNILDSPKEISSTICETVDSSTGTGSPMGLVSNSQESTTPCSDHAELPQKTETFECLKEIPSSICETVNSSTETGSPVGLVSNSQESTPTSDHAESPQTAETLECLKEISPSICETVNSSTETGSLTGLDSSAQESTIGVSDDTISAVVLESPEEIPSSICERVNSSVGTESLAGVISSFQQSTIPASDDTVAPQKTDKTSDVLESAIQISSSVCQTENSTGSESLSGLISSFQESTIPASADMVAPQKTHKTSDVLESPIQISSSVCETEDSSVGTESLTGVVSSFQESIIPASDDTVATDVLESPKEISSFFCENGLPALPMQQLPIKHAVVRLTRLPFSILTEESISFSRLVLKESFKGSVEEKTTKSETLCCQTDNMQEMSSEIKEAPTGRDVQASSVLHLTPITSKDPTEPHFQMTKTQFLAQLAVTPLDHSREKEASSQDDMTISEKKKFQKNSIVARLRSHVKAHWEARKSVRKSEEDTESRTPDITPKRPRLSNDGLNNKNAAGEPIISPENTNVKDDISPSTRKASVTPRTSDQCKGGGNPKKGVNEPTIASSRKSKATKDSTPVSSSNSSYLNGDGVDVENKMPESVIPRRSGSAKERGRTTETKSSSLSPRRSNSVKEKVNINESVSHKKSASNKEDVTTKNKKSTSVSPGPSPAKSTRPNKAESSLSPRRSCSAKENVNTKITESFSLSLRSSRSMITRASPEKSKSASVSPWRALSNKGVGKNKKSALGTRRSSSADTDKTKVTRSSCLSPRRSSSLKQNLDTEKTASSSMSTRKSPTVEKNNSPKKQSSSSHQNSSVSPRKSGTKNVKSTLTSSGSSSAKENASHNKKTRSSSLSPVKSNCTKEIDSPKKSISPSESPVKSAVEYEVVGPQTENSTSNPVRSTLMEESAIPDMTSASTSPKHIKSSPVSIELSNFEDTCPDQAESPPVTPRRSGEEQHDTLIRSLFTNRDSRIKQITRESKSFSLSGYSITATWGVSDSVGSPQSPKPSEMSEETTDPEKAEESTPAKKRRVIQGDIGSKKSRKVTSAEKLAKAAKARALAKLIKVNEAKRQTTPSADNQTNSGVKKCRGKVWVPPVMLASEMPPPGSKPWKKEIDTSAFYKDKFVTAPVVSPLQPLSVIGKFLLRNQCGECGRVFANSESLANHVSLHNIQRPFQCKFCGKAFPESKSFKRHDRVHRNGKIHICPQCGKGFVYRFGLSKHIQMVHGRIKPFICQICNKGFYTRRDVEAHIRMHTGEKPFQCTLCERRFIRKVELNVHLRWHNGEKRHWCIFCGKGFLDSNNLKRHVYTHTGEKPYSCPHCPKQFAQTGHMKKHIRNVHGE
ncbi:uncharacterized protein KZ484_023688 isoform 1-T1 [Pholidichthys leucotaenia]